MNFIKFSSIDASKNEGKKYVLGDNYVRQLSPDFKGWGWHNTIGVYLSDEGMLHVYSGFKWDGASGALDTADFMAGSMVHDALCELIREGKIPESLWNAAAREMYVLNRENGMPRIRAIWTFLAVRLWGRLDGPVAKAKHLWAELLKCL